MNYKEFLKTKERVYVSSGFDVESNELNDNLFDFQKAIVKWALHKGKCALFMDTGLGKTICQLEFANQVCKHENGKALILAPLAVSKQTKSEGDKFGINVNICRTSDDVKDGINITNYEMLSHFNPDDFVCVVLDESSIIKEFTGKVSSGIIDTFRNTKYKLACTATPSPNDYQELGTHSEFLNVLKRKEMLATFFINDAKESQWRLKRHAEGKFWEWVATWAMVVKTPSDIGYPDDRYNLPKLNIEYVVLDSVADSGRLLPTVARTLTERRAARKTSLIDRVSRVKDLMSDMDRCLIFVDYNDESTAIKNACNVVEVKGSDTDKHKEDSMLGFAKGDIPFMVSKPSICGFGMNFQICNNIIFCGISDSYERFYQAIRRCWRFGQTKPVNVYVVLSQKEMSVLNNIIKKQKQHEEMSRNMVDKTSKSLREQLNSVSAMHSDYITTDNVIIPNWLVTER